MTYVKKTWVNKPNTTTPIMADDLNHIEQGIYDNDQAIATKATLEDIQDNLVNVSTEVDEDYRVNFLKSKNLFDKNNLEIAVYNYGTTGVIPPKISSTTRCAIGPNTPIKVKPNTKYTFSSIDDIQVSIGELKSDRTLIQSTNWTQNTLTITTTANTEYIIFNINYSNSTTITSTIFTTIQNAIMLNEGETALTYEPFVQNQILVDNEKYTDTLNVGTSLDSRSRVNVLKSKNLLDLQFLQLLVNSSGTVATNISAYDVILDTKNISSIYVSGDFTLLDSGVLRIGKYSTYPVVGSTGTRETKSSAGSIDTSSSNYILLSFIPYNPDNFANNVKASFMLNEGSTALPYEPYITPSIYVDNEMLVSKNVYSTGEVVIGEWFGKPLYRKVFTITSLTSSNTNLVDVSGLSIDFAKISGTIITSTGAKFPINLYDSASNYSVIIISDSGYIRGRGVIGSGTLSKCIVILEYTKTTDA